MFNLVYQCLDIVSSIPRDNILQRKSFSVLAVCALLQKTQIMGLVLNLLVNNLQSIKRKNINVALRKDKVFLFLLDINR